MTVKKSRLDQAMVGRGLVATRSQAESWIRLGKVFVAGKAVTKPDYFVADTDKIALKAEEQYVSRAALKLASVAGQFGLDFANKTVLDVGSSTGGFTDFALRHGARKVIAVDVGKGQLHASLRSNPQVELHEQTDIRDVFLSQPKLAGAVGPSFPRSNHFAPRRWGPPRAATRQQAISESPDIVVIDVSFISLREVLPHVATLCSPKTQVVAMLKPQFEATAADVKHKGVIKNDRLRRDILKSFEDWARQYFVVKAKADSQIAGSKGNVERFYLMQHSAKGRTPSR